MKLYAVTEGAYSDYHIVTLQADEAKAYKIAAVLSGNGDVYDVEEFESDDWEEDPRPVWSVYIEKGQVILNSVSKTESTVEWSKTWPFGRTVTYVKAKTAEQAVKILQDRLAEEKARKEGLA